MSEKKHKLEIFLHILTAFVLLLKGFDKMQHHHLLPGSIITVLGVVILVITLAGKRFGFTHNAGKLTCYVIEVIALSLTAYVYLTEGKKFLPFAFLFSALLYGSVAIAFYYKNVRSKLIH